MWTASETVLLLFVPRHYPSGGRIPHIGRLIPRLYVIPKEEPNWLLCKRCLSELRNLGILWLYKCPFAWFYGSTVAPLLPLNTQANIVPLIAKADTLTLEERTRLKKQIMDDIVKNQIQVYSTIDERCESLLMYAYVSAC